MNDSLIRFVLHSRWLIKDTGLLLLLYVNFLRHSPWFYAKIEYLGGGGALRRFANKNGQGKSEWLIIYSEAYT